MRILIAALFVIFVFQFSSKADVSNIGEFEIEGIVLKESLLNHFKSEDIEIKKELKLGK